MKGRLQVLCVPKLLKFLTIPVFVVCSVCSSGEQELAVVTHSLTVQERLETIETIDVTAYKEADTTDEESVDEEVGDILAEAEDAETESEEVSDEKES